MSIREDLQTVCKDAGIELPEEFDLIAVERNGRIDVITNSTETMTSLEHRGHYLDLLRPAKEYGWKIEFGGGRVLVHPPKEEKEEETTLTGKRKTVNSIHEVTGLLTGGISEAWKAAEIIGDSKVYVPATKVSQHHKDVLASNVRELERAGWLLAAHASGLGRSQGVVTHYELTAPLEFAPTDDVKVALARVLRLIGSDAEWIRNGVARGRTIVFEKNASGHSYNFALGYVRSLLARGWSVEQREGLAREVVITAPVHALTASN